MQLLKRLFKREDRFLSLLEASAGGGKTHATALHQLLTSPSPAVLLNAFLQARVKEQEINAAIDSLLLEGHSSVLEREDIERLARALQRIPKRIRKFAERYLLCSARIAGVSFAQQFKMLEAAIDLVNQMVCDLKGGLSVAAMKKQNDALQKIEKQADKLLMANMVALYQGHHEPMKAIMLKDLYEQLDRVFDRCRNTGNLILQIVLKHS